MPASEPLAADLVLLNGSVLTMDAHDTVAEALAIKHGRLQAVGASRDVAALSGPGTEVVDLRGRTVLPGLADCHVHLASGAGAGQSVECRDLYDPGIRSVQDILRRLRERAARAAPGTWIVGQASPLAEYRLAEGRRVTRQELDEVVPSNPCYVFFGPHVVVANSRALGEKGITRDTPDPQGGVVVKDPTTGEPTGELRERAQHLVKIIDPPMSVEELAEAIRGELLKCAARGVTTVHDIVVARKEVLAYQLLDRAGRLPVRVQLLIRVIESKFSKESLLDLGFVHGFGSDMLKIGGVKMSVDGGISGKNAAFAEPLEGEGEPAFPLIRIAQDELNETVWRYHELGMRCCVHVVGDVAIDMGLKAYEKALARLPRAEHRHRLEHLGCWAATPEHIARAKQLGVIPVPNPPFLYHAGEALADMLGRRMEHSFSSRWIWDAGLPLTFGSDGIGWHPVDALRDAGIAVSRRTLQGKIIAPDQALTLPEALRAVTVNAAFVGFDEARLGTLEPGKLADAAVLGEDPFAFPPEHFKELPVDLTIVGGQVVHSR